MREAAEPPHDVAVVLRLLQVPATEAAAELDGAFLVRQIFGVPERQIEEPLQLDLDERSWPGGDRRIRERRAAASVAYMRGVPRNELRGNWSSKIMSASAPTGVALQPSSSPRAAASCSGRKRSRKRRSNPSSLANQRAGPAPSQNATTSRASAGATASRYESAAAPAAAQANAAATACVSLSSELLSEMTAHRVAAGSC